MISLLRLGSRQVNAPRVDSRSRAIIRDPISQVTGRGSQSEVFDPGGRQFAGRVKSLVVDRNSWIESLGFRGRQYIGRVKSFFQDF